MFARTDDLVYNAAEGSVFLRLPLKNNVVVNDCFREGSGPPPYVMDARAEWQCFLQLAIDNYERRGRTDAQLAMIRTVMNNVMAIMTNGSRAATLSPSDVPRRLFDTVGIPYDTFVDVWQTYGPKPENNGIGITVAATAQPATRRVRGLRPA